MNLDDPTAQIGEWLRNEGPDSDIVLSSRVRLARNLEDYQFPSRISEEDRKEAVTYITEALSSSSIKPPLEYYSLNQMSETDREMLVERHLTSKEHSEASGERGVAVSEDESVAVMVNEEDHLRIQVFRSAFRLEEAWSAVNELDDVIGSQVNYAFSPEFGYLSACPTNVGTGLRASVMLHMPALAMSRQVDSFFRSVNRINLAVRGLYGEGTEALGNLFQVSNQVSLGKSEEEIIENLASAIPQIVHYERQAREHLIDQSCEQVEDRVWRAFGMLKTARTISSNETLELLSHVRLGINVGLIDTVDIQTVNQLFVLTLPAHLQKIRGESLGPRERDIARADFIRRVLGEP